MNSGSGISTLHPLYVKYITDWEMMDDAFHGERIVKEKSYKYLPATPGQFIDGLQTNQKGRKNYLAYKMRARFPEFVSDAVEALLGVMHHKPATIELPDQMMALIEKATIKGESLQMLLRRINEHQLITGRLGLLADIEDGAQVGTLPYIALYKAKDIINWDDTQKNIQKRNRLNLVILDESRHERTNLNWQFKRRYRALILGELDPNDESEVYQMAVLGEDGDLNLSSVTGTIVPSIAGTTLTDIPFVIVNSTDIVAEPDDPPLLGLANLSMVVYRGEADYRQALFNQGQDTLVIIGGTDEDEDLRVGAGAHINVVQGGNAKYIGTDSKGLKEMRESLQNDKKEASESGGKLLDTRQGQAESGEALRIRVGARTASLNQIATTGAEALQTILRMIAVWCNCNPDEVVVTANMDFADASVEGRTLVDWMSAKALGLPWSKESIHRKLQEKDFTEMEYEDEIAAIEDEAPEPGGEGTGVEEDEGGKDERTGEPR